MFCHDVHFNEPWPSARNCRAAIEKGDEVVATMALIVTP